MDSLFLRPDDPRYAEILTDAAVHVLADAALDRFSIGAIARWMRVSPPSILKRRSRAEVIEEVVAGFCTRWLR